MKFIFDVDGTLTPSRQLIDPKFERFFEKFCLDNDVYLVTGSDYGKTQEQLGDRLLSMVKIVYGCSGNDVWSKGVNIRRNDWTLPDELRELLESWVQSSTFRLRTGNHIEHRPGTVNFSIVGRNATHQHRQDYIKHDVDTRERESISYQINSQFENITATVGGETGIDIYPSGCDKGQVYYEFDASEELMFFGDKMEPGGNDYPLGKHLDEKNVFHVRDWQHTMQELMELQNKGIAK